MTASSPILRSALVAMVIGLAACADPRPPVQNEARIAPPQDLFTRVNGVSLHYLDWGGTGDLLLLLHGWSHTAHSFDGIAPAFTDRYHVMGLTRRGHGASAKPDSGYSLETFVDDIVAFVDAVGAKRVVLVGVSFAGRELPLVAARLGSRATGLVFLDAVYQWPGLANAQGTADVVRFLSPPDSVFRSRESLESWYRWRDPASWPAQAANLRSQTYLGPDGRVAWQMAAPLNQVLLALRERPTDFTAIKVPTLAIWANQAEPLAKGMAAAGWSADDVAVLRKWVAAVDIPVKRAGIAALKEAVPGATVVEMEAPHVLYWYKPAETISEMNKFLASLGR